MPANGRNDCPSCAGWKSDHAALCRACRAASAIHPCGQCGMASVLIHERCVPCYQYRWRTGRERPAYLWDGSPTRLPCRVCGAQSAPTRTRWCQKHYQQDLRARQRAAS